MPVCSGVPNGSVLEPILLLIYINDLADTTVRVYADDTIVFLTIEGENDLAALQPS